MSVQSVEVRNSDSILLGTIPIGVPSSSQDYFIKDIDGLGPTDAILAMSSFADYDGAVFHGGRLNQRIITMKIGYSPNYKLNKGIGQLRKQAYTWFPPKMRVGLYINDLDRPRVYIFGYVEKIEPAIFAKEPEMQITIVCEEAYFATVALITLEGVANTPININNEDYGDAPTGFTLTMRPTANFSRLDIRNGRDPNIVIAYPFASGDIIKISTVPGNKSATVTRGGEMTPLLDRLVDSTVQMTLGPPAKTFNVVTANATPVKFDVVFRPKWLGV